MISAFLTLTLSVYFFVKVKISQKNRSLNGFCFGVFLVIAVGKMAPFVATVLQKLF